MYNLSQGIEVTANGTLILSGAISANLTTGGVWVGVGGEWACSLVSEAGVTHTRAHVNVIPKGVTPPPIITFPPTNQVQYVSRNSKIVIDSKQWGRRPSYLTTSFPSN